LRRKVLSFVVSLAIGGGLLYLASREVDFAKVQAHFREADGSSLAIAIAVYVVLFSVVHALRMWRWVFLLRTLGPVSLRAVFRTAALGFTAIMLLPLRLGELVRPYAISRESPEHPFSAALGTVVVERVIDGLFITLLLFLTLGTYTGTESTTFATAVGTISLVIFAGALGVSLAALYRRQATLSLVQRLVGTVSPKAAGVLMNTLATFLDGVRALREGHSLLRFLAVTVAYWTVNGLSIAFLASYGFGLDVGPWAGMTVLAILVVGIMVPAGPGFAGNYEYFGLAAMGLFVSADAMAAAGAAFIATMHACQFVVQVMPGLWVHWAQGAAGRVGFFELAGRAERAAAVRLPPEGTESEDKRGAP
jgi:uncharacterized protein (TIRG00374 family)